MAQGHHDLQSVAEILRDLAVAHPGRAATICAGRITTCGELDARANRVANGFVERRRPGATAAVLDSNSESFFELLFGAARAGHVLVPINTRLSALEAAEVITDAGAELIFAGADYAELAEQLAALCPSVATVITIGEANTGRQAFHTWREAQSATAPETRVSRSDVVLLGYTSGTTGRARGAELTHGNLLTNAGLLADEHGRAAERDAALVALPLYHVGGSLWALACLHAGMPIVILPRAAPRDILLAISQYRVTKAFLVPALIRLLLDELERETYDVSSLDLLLYGGSPMDPEVLGRALATIRCRFGQVYGLTETAGSVTYLRPEDHVSGDARRLLSCGRPLGHAEIRVLDESGHEVPSGQIGEIVCRTPQNMRGYRNLPADTASVLRNGWFHTGDAGYFDEHGYLYIHDRLKDMIVSGGENVYPAEIERILMTHAAVADAAVIGVPDERWGEAVKAFLVRRPGAAMGADSVMTLCRERLAGYKVPRSVEFVESLPRNASGKVLKRELRSPFWSGRTRQVN
jgi:acyl-CoA synthetase (AMP-forming)/AMP-acid ligase II